MKLNGLMHLCLALAVIQAMPMTAYAGTAYRDVIIEKDISGSLSVDNAGYGDNLQLRKRLTQADAFAPLSYNTVGAMLSALTLPADNPKEITRALQDMLLSRAEYPASDGGGYVFERRLFALKAAGAGDKAATLAAAIPAELADSRLIDMRDALLAEQRRFDDMCDNRSVRSTVARERSDADSILTHKEDAARVMCALFHEDAPERAALLAAIIHEQYNGNAPEDKAIRRIADLAARFPEDALAAWALQLERAFVSEDTSGEDDAGRIADAVAELSGDIANDPRVNARVARFAANKQPLPFALAQALMRSDRAGAGLLALFYQIYTQGGVDRIDSGLKKDAARLLSSSGLSPAAKALHALYGEYSVER